MNDCDHVVAINKKKFIRLSEDGETFSESRKIRDTFFEEFVVGKTVLSLDDLLSESDEFFL